MPGTVFIGLNLNVMDICSKYKLYFVETAWNLFLETHSITHKKSIFTKKCYFNKTSKVYFVRYLQKINS
jgi:hypothetical protein